MKKYKVNVDRPKPTSEEILSRRNFDDLMKQYQAAPGKVVHKPFWKTGWFVGAVATAAAVAVTVIVLNKSDDSASQHAPVNQFANGANTRNPDSSGTGGSFVQEKRRIAPPLKGMDVAFASFKVTSSKGGIIEHKSGSRLVFKANAFVDASGKPVAGDVDIRYREFRNPVDVFVAGIPMQYDSAGQTYQFESAGMMEIAAFMNGKVVYLDKNKPVEVQFASAQSGSQFSVYEFDTAAGNWAYRGKDEIRPKDSPEAGKKKPDAAEVIAKKAAADKQLSLDLSLAATNNPLPEEPVKPLKADPKKNRFDVDFDVREFPEMAGYKNVLFEVDESREKFDRKNYDIVWESIELSKGDRDGRYHIALRKGLLNLRLDVYPVFEGGNYEQAMKTFVNRFDEYSAALGKRQKSESAARQKYDEALAKLNVNSNTDDRFQKESQDAYSQVFRVFSIEKFGVYNCDKPEMLPQGGVVTLNCRDENGRLLNNIFSMYHVDRNKFCLYSYHNVNPVAGFHFNPGASNLVWVIINGELYTADQDQFTGMPVSGSGEIVLKPVNRQFKDLADMRAFFGFTSGV